MKKIFAILALVGIATVGVAQNIKAGLYDKQGNAVVVEAEPIVVNVTLRVATEHFTPGVYARYAQKYLGKRATLSEYSSLELVDAKLTLGQAEELAPKVEQESYTLPLPLNRTSATAQTTEEQAAATADMIFSLRKHRLDLITGEAGENVFGEGLKSALDEIARLEQAYLELFLGKKVVTTYTHRVAMPMSASSQAYAVAKISSSKGILAAASQEGEAITLNVTPSNKARLSSITEVDPKDKTAIQVRIADPATCVVMVGNKAVASAVLPIFELGRTAYISGAIKR